MEYYPNTNACSGTGTYMSCGMGNISDGNWHTIERNLQADMDAAQSGTIITSVAAVYVRGNVTVDNIYLRSPVAGGGSNSSEVVYEDGTDASN